MLIARAISKESSIYVYIKAATSSLYQSLLLFKPYHLIAIWSIMVSGIVFRLGEIDRHVYWNWESMLLGFIKIILVTILFHKYILKKEFWKFSLENFSLNNSGSFLVTCLTLFTIGYLDTSPTVSTYYLFGVIPYLLSFLGIALLFKFNLVYSEIEKKWLINDWINRKSIYLQSSSCLIVATILGYILDDPIISTICMILLFFPLVGFIWPAHERHVQRSQFYTIFTFSMFLCVRAPWFFIPVFILFFVSRALNYFHLGIVHPSFGVDLIDE